MKKSNTITALGPHDIVRLHEGKRYFGLGPTALHEKIKSGEIPAPFDLSDSGRAKAWTGQMIIDHHRARIAAAKAKKAEK